jgi:acetyl esterase/lipase
VPQPPSGPLLSRELVRVLPFSSPEGLPNNFIVFAGNSTGGEMDVMGLLADRNQFLPGLPPNAAMVALGAGPLIDITAGSPQPITITVSQAVDNSCSYRITHTFVSPGGAFSATVRASGRYVFVIASTQVTQIIEFGYVVRPN